MDRQAPGGKASFSFGWGDNAGKTYNRVTWLLISIILCLSSLFICTGYEYKFDVSQLPDSFLQ